MHNFFKKINLVLPNYSNSLLKGEVYRIYPFGLSYYHIADKKIFTELQYSFPIKTDYISYFEITNSILPHTDENGTVVLNYYICSGPAKTDFYEQTNDQTLNWRASFISKDNSCYLLNVSKWHSVQMFGSNVRTAISFGFPNHSYEEIVQKLHHLWID